MISSGMNGWLNETGGYPLAFFVAIAGLLSNVCVESTARSAYDLGYRVRVIHDAVAAASRSNQEYVQREIYPLLGGSTTVGRERATNPFLIDGDT